MLVLFLIFTLVLISFCFPAQGKAYEITKFDTNDVEKYPIFSIDLYNCQIPTRHDELSKNLENAVLGAFPSKRKSEKKVVKEINERDEGEDKDESERESNLAKKDEVECSDSESIPDLQAMHLLKSTDKLSCIVLAAWTGTK